MLTDTRGARAHDAVRPPEITLGFHRNAEGSVLYRAGGTLVLATASVDETLPEFLRNGPPRGWLTAEYQMHPRASPARRERRDGRDRPLGGRSTEIQRLIGRSLRAAVDFAALGPRTLTVDCDVLEADGGTRTASITAGWLALAQAAHRLRQRGLVTAPILRDQLAAVSAGIVAGEHALDLCYREDSRAEIDFNVVGTPDGRIVELQGTAEDRPVARRDADALVDLALAGIRWLGAEQVRALEAAGLSLATVLASPVSP